MSSKDIIDLLKVRVKEVFIPETVIVIYVYGSILKGKIRSDSDVDIAMLPYHGVNALDRLKMISEIEGTFTSIFKKIGSDREVSVLDMRGKYVSLQLLYKVITEGKVLFEKDITQRIEFENAVKREYFDFEPYLIFLRKRKYGDIFQEA